MGEMTMNGQESDSGAPCERRFTDCCTDKLPLNEPCMKKALEIFRATYTFLAEAVNTFCTENVEHHWTASILYVVKKTEPTARFTLNDILRATGSTLFDFFREAPNFLSKCDAPLKRICGEDYTRIMEMREHHAMLTYLTILFNYYRRIYPTLFVVGEKQSELSDHQKFGWMLFLAIRNHALGKYPDLVTCTNALLAALTLMVVHMPVDKRAFSLEDQSVFAKKDSQGINIVGSLAKLGEAFEDDVKKIVPKAQEIVAKIFSGLTARSDLSDVASLAGFNTDGLLYFDGLMNDATLAENMTILAKDYERAYAEEGDLDWSFCMNNVEGYKVLSNASNSMIQNQQKLQESHLTQADSPAKPSDMPPPTPLSSAMTTAKWLRIVIAPLPTEPTQELRDFFKACDRDITGDVTHRTKALLESIFPTHQLGSCSWKTTLQNIGTMDNSWTEQRRLEAAKLYYRVLASVCRAESQRLNTKNLSSVLMNEKFHRCMLTCSAELVLATHKTVIMTFPAVLEPAGITAFDLTKVIESFIRHEETLPRELKRHLNFIEERLLESMAWEKGSSMYNALIVARPRLASEITRLGLLAEPMPSLDTLAPALSRSEESGDVTDGNMCSPERETVPKETLPLLDQARTAAFVSPVKERASAFSAFNSGRRGSLNLQSVFASPHRPNPLAGGETCAETTIAMFFQKVLKLSSFRAKSFVERIPALAQSASLVTEAVFRVVQYALQNVTSLFFKRHNDQIILCSVYGVCKVLKLNVTFKEIIQNYRKTPHCKNHVFKNVFLDLRRGVYESGDIIKFYNDIFVPAVKNILGHIATAPTAASLSRNGNGNATEDKPAPGSPRPSTLPAIPDMSPKKVSSQHNVYVSPLRSARAENILSPHSRSLYACLGESTRSYQSPSRDLTLINNRLNPRRGRLVFDDASVMSDSEAAGAFTPATTERPPTSESALPPPPAPQSPPAKRPKLDR